MNLTAQTACLCPSILMTFLKSFQIITDLLVSLTHDSKKEHTDPMIQLL